ncbi:1-acyl-sn-glycerol-3-phosphate acyltransferase [Agriterribacter sp.]|uniref:1-acyl-sn-glycerol-3-phosphate acyltransferase n=1 Tax=Agriterribacter sp. TaxID=2821509 RepID=UPI002CAD2135|nr:1-acyl-sn-glycerol-3-phosphate acyltransferase [Agriterribacter sp.]HRO47623.1 1-acyl-sn-glycerol-3-phosphate acyltransferase [Agriterribacter sp.]HRQ17173.1 1-acyl-sn-glycerol-3-phosphate acyltransferase [Agriterribacter sp.]
MEKIFAGIYRYFQKRRWQLYLLFSICLIISAFFAARLKFEEDIAKILPRDEKVEKLNYVFRHSKFMDKLVVMVSFKDTAVAEPDSLVAFGDDFAAQLQEKLSPYISKISYKVDDEVTMAMFDVINAHLPVYLTENDYHTIDSLTAPDAVKQTLARNIQTLSAPAGLAFKNMISNDPVGISFIALKKLQQLQYDENFELYDNAVITKDHKNLLLFITPQYPPNNTGKNALFLKGLDSLIVSQTTTAFPAISASYFGATAVSAGNAAQLEKDTLFTQTATIIFLILFIGFYFKRVAAPILIMIPVVFGALFALMAVYFIRESISVIAIGTGSVILGIAVNYSLHVFNHYRHTGNMQKVIGDLAFPLTLGGITTIGGFFCLNFAASDMLKDLGLFAGFSLIGASLCSLIFLPHFLSAQKKEEAPIATRYSWIDRIAALRPDHNRYVITGIVVLTLVFFYTSGRVGFETELNNMNFMPDDLKKAEAKLNSINEAALQSVYLVAEGKTLDEALVLNEKLAKEIEAFKAKDIISKYSGVSSLLISDTLQRQRIARWNNYWTPEKKRQLLSVTEQEGAALGYSATAFNRFALLLNKYFDVTDSAAMAAVRKTLLDDYISEAPGKATVVTLLKVPAQSKAAVYDAFENKPGATILDKQYLTGKFVELINADFTNIALITSLLVFFVLLITYGRIELALMAFLPMLVSWIWILGIMGIAGIKFNIINIIVSTLIFGLGDDYSIFIMDGLLQEYKTGKKNLSSFKSSILLSAITATVGLGVLIFAQHPALRSIAMISVIGILCVVLVAQVCIPFLFSVLIRNRTQQQLFPWTFFGLCKSMFAHVWFIGGSIILAVIGFILIKCNPFNKEKGSYLFHVAIARFSGSLIYIMGNVKKMIINPLGENFSNPAVIICNHQSGLDNFILMMQYPKLILLTNDRVRHAPVSGAVVRMADYYSASAGAENSIEQMREKVKKGYSVVIFPEGTRSPDGKIKRFHKGAFYLAEQLHLDVLPVVIHGTGYTMTKKDMLVKDGKITVQFLPRIKPDDKSYGNSYSERAKQVGSYFRAEYEKLRASVEVPSWFREQLFYNYIYKGPVLEWYMRVKVKLEKDYLQFHRLVPLRGKVLDIGCGYGFMSYMLHFAAPGRIITGIDYDAEKTIVANHCFSRNERIGFKYADVLDFAFEQYDSIIIADMLHYLTPEQQKQIIGQCLNSLHAGGTLIIRDGDRDLEAKHKGTRLTEFFSTKLFGFNKTTASGLSFLSGSMIYETAAAHHMECRKIDETKYTSNVIFVIQNRNDVQ